MAKKYGTEVAERLKAFGGGGRRLIEQYGDELADIIGRLSEADVKKAIELINAYGDDALELFKDGKNVDSVRRILESKSKTITKTDRIKIDSWKYRPSDELYLQYKAVFDNPKYYNQTTGEINWPANDGFLNIPTRKVLNPGTRIDRYGGDMGLFTSPEGIPYEMRALAPGTDMKPYSVFEVVEPIEVKAGEIAPWFDEPGGGIQYLLPESVEDLLEAGIIRRVE